MNDEKENRIGSDPEQPEEIIASAENEASADAAAEMVSDEVTAEEAFEETTAAENVPVKKKKVRKSGRIRNTRRLHYGSSATAVAVVVVAAVILLNVIVGIVADRYPITLDLSKDQIYSLSDASVSIAKGIAEDTQIVVFYDESTFSNPNTGTDELDTILREFYNALKQYNTYSNGKVTYSFINPDQEPTKYAAYSDYGVQSGSILFLTGTGDSKRYKTCTLDDLYEADTSSYYYTGSTTISASCVEKALGSKLHALQSDSDVTMQVLVGHEEDSTLIDGLTSVYKLNGYTLEDLSISGSGSFNEKATAALIAAPKTDYSEAEIQKVRDWVYNDGNYGHNLIVYVSPTATCPNLYELLNVEYKIQVTDNLIQETDYSRISQYSAYYTLCDVPSSDYTKNSAGTAKVFAPQSRQLTTTLEALDTSSEQGQTEYAVTLTSYPESARLISLENAQSEDTSKAQATFKADNYPVTSMIVSVIDTYNNNTSQSVKGTITVSGCPYIAYSSIAGSGSFKNEDLVLDATNAACGVEETVSIDKKTLTADTVEFSDKVQLILGFGVFTVGLPVVLLVICLIVFLRRKNL